MFLKCISAPFYPLLCPPHTHSPPALPIKAFTHREKQTPLKKGWKYWRGPVWLVTAQCLTRFKTEPDQRWPKDAHDTYLTSNSFQLILSNSVHFWFIAMTKAFHIHIKTQDSSFTLVCFCKAFLPFHSFCSAATARGRHKAFKSFFPKVLLLAQFSGIEQKWAVLLWFY